jgi:hypothetical protein
MYPQRPPRPAPKPPSVFPPGLAILRPEFDAKDDAAGEFTVARPAAPSGPTIEPPRIPPPPWSENYIPEADEFAPEEPIADLEPEPLPRPALPPSPWTAASKADEELPSPYPPPRRDEP